MEKLEKEKVLHVASLAKLHLTEEEVEKFSYQLKDILTEIKKIEDVEIPDQDIVIAPCTNKNTYNEDTIGEMLSREEILKNANKKYGSYIAVTRALND